METCEKDSFLEGLISSPLNRGTIVTEDGAGFFSYAIEARLDGMPENLARDYLKRLRGAGYEVSYNPLRDKVTSP